MKLFNVSYKLQKTEVRALLKLDDADDILPTLVQYHYVKTESIQIIRIREIKDYQKVLQVQYFDREV